MSASSRSRRPFLGGLSEDDEEDVQISLSHPSPLLDNSTLAASSEEELVMLVSEALDDQDSWPACRVEIPSSACYIASGVEGAAIRVGRWVYKMEVAEWDEQMLNSMSEAQKMLILNSLRRPWVSDHFAWFQQLSACNVLSAAGNVDLPKCSAPNRIEEGIVTTPSSIIIQEHIPGLTMYDLVTREGSIDAWYQEEAKRTFLSRLFFQIAYALFAAQVELGFTHNDLHLFNIVVEPTDRLAHYTLVHPETGRVLTKWVLAPRIVIIDLGHAEVWNPYSGEYVANSGPPEGWWGDFLALATRIKIRPSLGVTDPDFRWTASAVRGAFMWEVAALAASQFDDAPAAESPENDVPVVVFEPPTFRLDIPASEQSVPVTTTFQRF